MKFVFLHPTHYAYDPQTPLTQPLGGTESAVAYLSAALVRAGAKVTLLNKSPVERYVDGVHIANNNPVTLSCFDDCDLVVVISGVIGGNVRSVLPPDMPLVLWCHLDIDQPAVQGLAQQQEKDPWTGYVMVSDWQAQRFITRFGLPAERVHVVRNAVSPAFLEQPVEPAWFELGAAPTLVYTSTPFRGLDILLQSFPSIRAHIPDVQLKIHSSMNIYGVGLAQDSYTYLYNLAQSLPGVDYVGPLSQAALAGSLQNLAALAYPSTFRETSCIAVMEAMASGVDLITTDLGALPETLNGFGHALSMSDHYTGPTLCNGFIKHTVDALNAARSNPSLAAETRRARVAFARENYTWDVRAREWIALAERLKSSKPLLATA